MSESLGSVGNRFQTIAKAVPLTLLMAKIGPIETRLRPYLRNKSKTTHQAAAVLRTLPFIALSQLLSSSILLPLATLNAIRLALPSYSKDGKEENSRASRLKMSHAIATAAVLNAFYLTLNTLNRQNDPLNLLPDLATNLAIAGTYIALSVSIEKPPAK